ncbi:MAG TPA: retropepsin-like aspartic protease [Terriglobales bacterium]
MQKFFPSVVLALVAMFWLNLPGFAADLATPGEIVPFKLYRGHMIVVECSVGGLKSVTAIIDTGASETVLDMELVRKLSLAIQPDSATFITQQAKVWAVSIPGLRLGPIGVDRLEGIATDLSSLTADLGIRPQVLIGMDVLDRLSFVIDYHSRKLVFGQPPRLTHSAPLVSRNPGLGLSGGSGFRMTLIDANVLGKRLRLQVDSGFAGLLLYGDRTPDLARENVADGSRVGRGEAHIANLGQSLRARSFAPPDVQIGDWHASHAQILLVDGPPPESADFDGLIGTAFLSQRRVAFDFQNARICWE